jgi:hypothetical protein
MKAEQEVIYYCNQDTAYNFIINKFDHNHHAFVLSSRFITYF